MNGDGFDDLSFGSCPGLPVYVYTYSADNGSFQPFFDRDGLIGSETEKSLSVNWVDFDNDGDEDLFTSNEYTSLKLFRNNGDGSFSDITISAGIDTTRANAFATSWGDFDRDGWLDAYVVARNALDLSSNKNWLYHNNGDGTFTDVSVEAGVEDVAGPGLQSVFFDYDNDLWPDLFVSNDKITLPNKLFHNNGDGTFTDVSDPNTTGLDINAMCVAVGDYDQNGYLDLYVTNSPDTRGKDNVLLRNNGDGTFDEIARELGVQVGLTSWGANFEDFDNDGDLDLFVCNQDFALGNSLFENQGNGQFVEDTTIFRNDPALSFGSATADINHDGYYDLAFMNVLSPMQIFLNEGGDNHWIKIDLIGTVSNRNAIGSWIKAYVDSKELIRFTLCGQSYASQNPHYQIIGVGSATVIDSLVVLWPSGLKSKLVDLPVDQHITLTEGPDDLDGDTHPMANDNCPWVHNPDQTDQDGDGAGESCDCDDQDASIVQNVWFADSDMDGFGDALRDTTLCTPPEGFVGVSTDCNDQNPLEFPGQLWFRDNDNDGFGNSEISIAMCSQPLGYVDDDSDCDDGDALNYPGKLWYKDSDGDGAGDPSEIVECAGSLGFVDNGVDCDDSNPGVTTFPWYADEDQDGFGDSANLRYNCEQPEGFVSDNADCNDHDSLQFPGQTWYLDSDHDGHGISGTAIIQCSRPAGYAISNDDCNDQDPNEFPGQIWYRDADMDGFGNPDESLIQCTRPQGYVVDHSDCDDMDVSVSEILWFRDGDEDGFGNLDSVLINCSSPPGYVSNGTDCNDSDPFQYPGIIWYKDNDGDGFGNPDSAQVWCAKPEGYVENHGDCDDMNSSKFPGQIWYADNDQDGFGDPEHMVISCEQPDDHVTNDLDCNDGDAQIAQRTWFSDFDRDGMGDPDHHRVQCEQPQGFVTNDLDCEDNDPDVFAGAPGLPDGKDNDCDGLVDKSDQTISFSPIPDVTLGDEPVSLEATCSSQLPIDFVLIKGTASLDSGMITFTEPGQVSVMAYQEGNEFYNPAEETQTFCVNPNPTLTFDPSGNVIALSDSGTYRWYIDGERIPNNNSKQLVVRQSGKYFATVSISGCLGYSDTLEVVITGVEEGFTDWGLRCFPNPAADRLYFEFSDIPFQLNLEVSLFSLVGTRVFEHTYQLSARQEKIEISLEGLPGGLYLYVLNSNKFFTSGLVQRK